MVTFPKNLPSLPCSFSPFNNNIPAAKIINVDGNIYESRFLTKTNSSVYSDKYSRNGKNNDKGSKQGNSSQKRFQLNSRNRKILQNRELLDYLP